eukprot:Pgem_evm1s20183
MEIQCRKLLIPALFILITITNVEAAITNNSKAKNNSCSENPVIIIGAGFAGSAAARDLVDRGCKVVLLEGRDRVGGRAHTLRDWGSGIPIEVGGAYIHGGEKKNPIRWVAEEKLGLKTKKSGGDSTYIGPKNRTTWVREAGSPYKEAEVEAGFELTERWWTCVENLSKDRKAKSLQDVSLHFATEACIEGFWKKNGSFVKIESTVKGKSFLMQWEKDLLLTHLAKAFEDDWALPMDQFPTFGAEDNYYFKDFEEEDRFVVGGMDQIATKLLKDIVSVYLNSNVTEVQYDENGAKVFIENTVTKERKIFRGSAVLSTLPLGVLKHGDVLFKPALPVNKAIAIDRQAVARLNHFHMEFENRFWEKNLSTYIVVPDHDIHTNNVNDNSDNNHNTSGTTPPNTWFEEFLCVSDLFQLNGNVLDMFWGGDSYWHEEDSDEKIIKAGINLLKKYFSPKGIDVPEWPKYYHISRYNSDPFAHGSYSSVRTHSTPEDWGSLAKPIGNTMFFAGEHTNTNGRYQTLDGAYMTGIREAARIAALPNNIDFVSQESKWDPKF